MFHAEAPPRTRVGAAESFASPLSGSFRQSNRGSCQNDGRLDLAAPAPKMRRGVFSKREQEGRRKFLLWLSKGVRPQGCPCGLSQSAKRGVASNNGSSDRIERRVLDRLKSVERVHPRGHNDALAKTPPSQGSFGISVSFWDVGRISLGISFLIRTPLAANQLSGRSAESVTQIFDRGEELRGPSGVVCRLAS